MHPFAFGVAALSLLCLALSLWAWQLASERERRARMERFLSRQVVAPEAAAELAREPRQAGVAAAVGPAGWATMVRRAGRSPDAAFHLRLLFVIAAAALLGLLAGGLLGLGLAALAALVGIYFWIWLQASRRQARMVEQLPGLLDAVVRLATIGNSIGAAFQTASAQVDPPLAEAMGRVASLNRSGVDLDQALHNVASLYGVREFHLLAAVLALALRFGGRSDQVLERMAVFMRDLRAARQELTAMSAEVRLSAWILALLPLGVAAFIIVFNNGLFMGMWNDGAGRAMLGGALALQILGSFWLYRMARAL